MSYPIEQVEGIGPAYHEKLKTAGINNTDDFLKHCADKAGRGKIAEATGLSEKHLLKWANMADLMRINGVAGQYAELLEAAGVDTVKELRHRNAANLAEAMAKANEEKNLSGNAPSESTIAGWIDEAGKIDPMITH